MTEHTPGPWTRRYTPQGEYVLGPESTAVARMQDGSIEGADARLIAAAPDLLAALRLTVEWLDNLGTSPELLDAMPNNFSRNIARTAIARALGQEVTA